MLRLLLIVVQARVFAPRCAAITPYARDVPTRKTPVFVRIRCLAAQHLLSGASRPAQVLRGLLRVRRCVLWAGSGGVTSFEPGCENKCASPYIGERFGENSVGGKWLMGALLRIPLTLLGHGNGAVGGLNYFADLL